MSISALELLETLVNIDSPTGDTEGFHRIGEIIAPYFQSLGFEWKVLIGPDGSRHFYTSRGTGTPVLLVAHLDTVFPKGTVAKRKFTLEGEIARGPGVSDCKSGVVTVIGAMERLFAQGDTNKPVACLFNTDEETGSLGSRSFIEDLARDSRAVLVAEPADGEKITLTRKGIGRYFLKIQGRAAHSGANYEAGRNAILEMAHKIIAIQNLTDLQSGMTLNVGLVQGGTRVNVVPEFAEAEIDLRLTAPEQEAKVLADLQRIVDTSTVPDTKAVLSGEVTRPPWPVFPKNQELYERYNQVAKSLGYELGVYHSGGGSDANFTGALGVPTIDGVGPIGSGHHSEAEVMDVHSLERRTILLAEFLRGF